MLPSLWLNNASATPPELIIREGEQVLGRSADADICLDETFVSGYHARLNWNTTQLTVLDLDSTNGTLVNGVPVIGWTSLTDGDVIEFGGIEATVRLPMESESNPVLGAGSHPPPPAPSRRRAEQRPTDTDPTGGGLVFGTQLGPIVSDQTEPLFDRQETKRAVFDQSVPDEPVLDQTVPDQTVLDQTVPDQTALDEPALDQPAPDEPAPDEPAPDEPVPEEPLPDQPVFDRPLTSAVTLPRTPPTGLSITEIGRTTGGYENLDDAGFDFGDHHNPSDQRHDSSPFDRHGLKLTAGTAAAAFVALVLVALLIVLVLQR